jgi:hypothetical protein
MVTMATCHPDVEAEWTPETMLESVSKSFRTGRLERELKVKGKGKFVPVLN